MAVMHAERRALSEVNGSQIRGYCPTRVGILYLINPRDRIVSRRKSVSTLNNCLFRAVPQEQSARAWLAGGQWK